ncbi:hypothetical protein F5X99DRAFT_269509 [Biscogniauxia marginata]|nr:hypothetical protein F5X99DRAFT_269509 [Biscogniauxia marginata]
MRLGNEGGQGGSYSRLGCGNQEEIFCFSFAHIYHEAKNGLWIPIRVCFTVVYWSTLYRIVSDKYLHQDGDISRSGISKCLRSTSQKIKSGPERHGAHNTWHMAHGLVLSSRALPNISEHTVAITKDLSLFAPQATYLTSTYIGTCTGESASSQRLSSMRGSLGLHPNPNPNLYSLQDIGAPLKTTSAVLVRDGLRNTRNGKSSQCNDGSGRQNAGQSSRCLALTIISSI